MADSLLAFICHDSFQNCLRAGLAVREPVEIVCKALLSLQPGDMDLQNVTRSRSAAEGYF